MPFVLCTAIISAVFCIALGVFVFIKNPKGVANRSFALFNISLASWTPSDLIKYIANPHIALIVYRLAYFGGSFITFGFLAFVWEIAGYKRPWIYRVSKWTAVAFAFLSQTSLLIRDIKFNVLDSNPIEEIHGPLYDLFSVFFVLTLLAAVFPLIVGYRKISGTRRKQVQYIMGAFAIGFVAVINFFANQWSDKIPPLFYLMMMSMCGVYAFTILKHQLMDITVIIRKTIIYASVMGMLMSIYLLTVTLLAHIFEGVSGYQTTLSSAIAAGLISFCFQPLRNRVQRFVDTKFFRQYVDREEKLYELSREVITHTTPEAMGQALMRVLQETIHPKGGVLFVKQNGDFMPAAIWGEAQFQRMDEDNPLARYFQNHPQPFVQELEENEGASKDTRMSSHKERPAA